MTTPQSLLSNTKTNSTSKLSTQEENNSSAATPTPSISTSISILSLCACPDVAFSHYTPGGDRPEGISAEKWRNLQTKTVSQTNSRFLLKVPYRPSICLLTSLGTSVVIDIEVDGIVDLIHLVLDLQTRPRNKNPIKCREPSEVYWNHFCCYLSMFSNSK